MGGKAAEKIGPVSMKTYSLSAKTLSEVCDEISGQPEAGQVSWEPVYKTVHDDDGKITAATVTVKITMELPSWTPPSTMGPKAKAEWNRWKAALRAHEDGHVEIVKKGFTGLAKQMLGKTEDDASTLFDKAKTDTQKASDSYDSKNGHGTKAGTNMDLSVEEDEQAAAEEKEEGDE
jgi:predicted secreted Zn-dependent protease